MESKILWIIRQEESMESLGTTPIFWYQMVIKGFKRFKDSVLRKQLVVLGFGRSENIQFLLLRGEASRSVEG